MSRKPRFSDDDLWLFGEGTHGAAYRWMGAHRFRGSTHFAVWAPAAIQVEVVGSWNEWAGDALQPYRGSGVWWGWIPAAEEGSIYKYRVHSEGGVVDKADPYGQHHEEPPKTASVVWRSRHRWRDKRWMTSRGERCRHDQPVSIYEVHLGSWRRGLHGESLSYRDLARTLVPYVEEMGYTHVELLPVMEHPYYGSWGYQCLGFFAPTCRYGSPDDLKYLIDAFHRRGVGVILDWVPAHFPVDEHGLGRFDGTALYEHADPRKGLHPDWGTYIFNYDRHEVRSFLLSSASYWIDEFHVDGLRVDAVASMLYLDYSRADGEWIPNADGGRENLGAIQFIRELNAHLYARFPGIVTAAEESTAWPGVSRPVADGGLGFGWKWDMGWMNDSLRYFSKDPVHRKHHHNDLTFRCMYAFSENYVLALSHDEVVHMKGSLPGKMPGDEWQRGANVRLLFGMQFAQPGKKLHFMGMEIAQTSEWDHEDSVPWDLLQYDIHSGVQAWVRALNALYRELPALHEGDFLQEGVWWSVMDDTTNSVISFTRYSADRSSCLQFIANCTPVVREGYRIGVPAAGEWEVALSSDDLRFHGTGIGAADRFGTQSIGAHGYDQSIQVMLPPLGALFLVPVARRDAT